VEKSLDLPVIAPLSDEQAGQFLGIPKGEYDPYFHVWFEKQDPSLDEKITGLLGFC
jgi:hypothetical protein